ncbi:MAG: phospho-sugar mutase [Atopobiaceae bacterium]|nr:phospho-sugar mutase [Atopobiaceae bacterium]
MASTVPAVSFSLHFGTGGIRALMGEGPNRLNEGTVAVATQGVSRWLLATIDAPHVVIARDCREHGEEFVAMASGVFAGNGIEVTDIGAAPTPMLSFAVRDLGCDLGLVLTASHNARDYNGYKVYGPDGCQGTTQMCGEIAREISRVAEVKLGDSEPDGMPAGLKDRYLDALVNAVPGPRIGGIRIAYSPLNGTGWSLVPEILRSNGFAVDVVFEQSQLDGRFPTCPYPNPEDADAILRVERLAKRKKCHVALATDPDADRVGVSVLHNEYMVSLSGDEVGELLLDWVCRMHSDGGEDVSGRIAVSTVVTSAALDAICAKWGLLLRRTLTGFKFVGEQIGLLESQGRAEEFLLGIEESLGYLSGAYVRDKDGVQGCLMVARMAAWYAERGTDLVDALANLRAEIGWNIKSQISLSFDDGEQMKLLMTRLRESERNEIAGRAVMERVDYLGSAPMPGDANQTLPSSDVLQWDLEDGSRLIIRPSGTEPKVKAYCFGYGKNEVQARVMRGRLEVAAHEMLA